MILEYFFVKPISTLSKCLSFQSNTQVALLIGPHETLKQQIAFFLYTQDYIVVQKSGVSSSSRPCVSGGLSRTQSPITEPPPHSLIHERNNDQRVLELTNKIIQLLTGEVPIRCEDVTVYFSMEEWEYLEGHKDLYKDVMMENHRPLTSLDGSSNRDTPERCPSPLYSQDCTEENQDEDLTDNKVEDIEVEEETYVRGDQQCKEKEIPTDISTADGHISRNTAEGHLGFFPDYEITVNITPDSPGKVVLAPYMHPELDSAHISSKPSYEECSLDNSAIVTYNTAHGRDMRFPCPERGKCFTQNTNLLILQRIHTGDKSFPCSECGKCFIKKSDLVRHQKIHTGERPFPCLVCGKCFTQKSNLINHQRIHTGEKPFSCSECGKSFTQKSDCVHHQKIHMVEEKFPCSYCGKCFVQKSDLRIHQIIHRGDKSYLCSECGKCFKSPSTLIRHQRVHTGEKPFPCSECGKCFSQRSNLVEHLATHTGEKPFPCSECGKCFRKKFDLIRHHSVHTGEKPFGCSECGKCFTQKVILVKHQRFHRAKDIFILMDKDRSHMTERILNLTLEIIYLLTGENCVIDPKKFGERWTPNSHPCVSGGLSRTQSPITEPPPHSLIHERNNDQRILELTNKIIQLLTGEVPIRCQDVTVYFSMEEWEYLEGHKGLYKDVIMENHQPLTSLDGPSKRNTPERCPRPLSLQENHNISQDYQGDLTNVKVEDIEGEEETYVRGDQQYKEEEIPTDISTDGHNNNSSEGHQFFSPICEMKDNNITPASPGDNPITPNTHPVLHSANMSSGPSNHEQPESDMVKHSAAYRRDKQCPCPECGKCFTQRTALIRHQRVHTGEKPFTCSQCGKCFTRKSNLIIHQRTHTGEKPFPCTECGKCFTRKSILIEHQIIHTDDKPYPCSLCGKCFKQRSVLVNHQKIHRSEKPFSCYECGKCFKHNAALVRHQTNHRGEKPFSCAQCGKSYTRKSVLKEHQRIHSDEKPFPCPVCGKCFIHKSILVKHLKIHTGEKPFSCYECGKCFTQNASLIIHQRNHTGQKPFLCSHCGKSFTRNSILIEHQRIHTDEKPFPCPVCGKCFTQRSILVKHQKIHTGERPFSCSDCGKTFTHKSNLVRHQIMHSH
ncbi:uncharacterized protein LOC142160629 [Mixophyes fleayi]|uniref:uncharacterized protein LOC142160629 n=1 Tax=Mixophyes fleayi TaxID=3061075 RepID=UPI003F4D8F62